MTSRLVRHSQAMIILVYYSSEYNVPIFVTTSSKQESKQFPKIPNFASKSAAISCHILFLKLVSSSE